MQVVEDERGNPIDLGQGCQMSRSVLTLCVKNLVDTIPYSFLVMGLNVVVSFCPCEGMPRFPLSS